MVVAQMSDSVRGLRLDSRSLTAAAYEGQVGFSWSLGFRYILLAFFLIRSACGTSGCSLQKACNWSWYWSVKSWTTLIYVYRFCPSLPWTFSKKVVWYIWHYTDPDPTAHITRIFVHYRPTKLLKVFVCYTIVGAIFHLLSHIEINRLPPNGLFRNDYNNNDKRTYREVFVRGVLQKWIN